VPTIRGGVEVKASQSVNLLMTVEFNSPANMLARVCLPMFGARHGASMAVTVDGKRVAAEADGDFLCVDGLGSGGHTVATVPR
jgi:hypothetical protein